MPKKPKTKPAAKAPEKAKSTIPKAFQGVANEIADDFDRVINELSLQESEAGLIARKVLRLRRDDAPNDEVKSEVEPIMKAYVKAMETDGILRFPVSRKVRKGANNAN